MDYFTIFKHEQLWKLIQMNERTNINGMTKDNPQVLGPLEVKDQI